MEGRETRGRDDPMDAARQACWALQDDLAPRSPQELRTAAAGLERLIRRRNIREAAAAALGIGGWLTVLAWAPTSAIRAGAGLVVAGGLCALWQLHRRAAVRDRLPQALGQPTLRYLRLQLVRQRDALRSAWLWYIAPLLPGMTLYFWGMMTHFPQVAWSPYIAVCAAVLGATAAVNALVSRRLQRRIESLDRLADPDAA